MKMDTLTALSFPAGIVLSTFDTCSNFSSGASTSVAVASSSPKIAERSPATPRGRSSCWLSNALHVLRTYGGVEVEVERIEPRDAIV